RADQQRRARSSSRRRIDMRFAVKAVFAVAVAGLDTDKTDIEPGVAVGGEAQRAGDVDAADDDIGLNIVKHFVTFTDEDAVPAGGHAALFPRGTVGPRAATDRADHRGVVWRDGFPATCIAQEIPQTECCKSEPCECRHGGSWSGKQRLNCA